MNRAANHKTLTPMTSKHKQRRERRAKYREMLRVLSARVRKGRFIEVEGRFGGVS